MRGYGWHELLCLVVPVGRRQSSWSTIEGKSKLTHSVVSRVEASGRHLIVESGSTRWKETTCLLEGRWSLGERANVALIRAFIRHPPGTDLASHSPTTLQRDKKVYLDRLPHVRPPLASHLGRIVHASTRKAMLAMRVLGKCRENIRQRASLYTFSTPSRQLPQTFFKPSQSAHRRPRSIP